MKKLASIRQFPAAGPKTRQPRRSPGTLKAPPLSAEARRRWSELVEEYAIDDAAGLQIVTTALEAFDRMRSAQAAIARDGLTSTDRFGQVKAHPLLPVERDARAAMLAALRQLNLDVEPLHTHAGRPAGGR